MKRILLIICILALFVLSAQAEGNAFLTLEGDAYVRGLTAVGDRLVLASDEALYTWREGEDGFTRWAADLRAENPDGKGEDAFSLYETAFFRDGDALRGLRVLTGNDYSPRGFQLFDAVLADGAVTAENPREIALPADLEGMEWLSVRNVVAREGLLYLVVSADNEMLCVLDPENPRAGCVETAQDWDLRLLDDGKGVLMVCDSWDESDGRWAKVSRVGADASLEEVCKLPVGSGSVAADPDTGAVFGVKEGRLCPADLEAGTLGEPAAALSMDANPSALVNGRWYAANMEGGVAILDTAGRLDEDALLVIRANFSGDFARKAVTRFAVEHPEVVPVMLYDTGDVLEAMMTRSPDTDVYILNTNYEKAYQTLLERGFMLPLDGSEALAGFYDRVYPGIRPFISEGGVMVALPTAASGSCMGFDEELLAKLGLSAGDLPQDWAGFLDFLENDVRPNLDKLGEKDGFTYDGMTARGFRFFLFQSILNDWVQANRAAGKVADYEDPRLVEVLERLDGMDFTEYGLEEGEEEDGYGYGWGGDQRYLIQINREFTFTDSRYMVEGVPVALGFGDDLPGTFALEISAAFVNPYSARPEAAAAFLEAMAETLPDTTRYTLCPDLTEPVRRPDWEQEKADLEDSLEEIRAMIEKAEPSEKQELQEYLERGTETLDEYDEKGSWLIPADAIARYRAIGDRLTVALPNWFQKDTSGEAWQLLEQYNARLITAREFLAAVNKKAHMMELEEGM